MSIKGKEGDVSAKVAKGFVRMDRDNDGKVHMGVLCRLGQGRAWGWLPGLCTGLAVRVVHGAGEGCAWWW